MAHPEPRVVSIRSELLEGDELLIKIKVRNEAVAAMHFYATARRIFYDTERRALRLVLHDRFEDADVSEVLLPAFVEIASGDEGEIELRLHRLIRELEPAAGPPPTVRLVDRDISRTRSVEIEIGCHSEPFVFVPVRGTVREQLNGWTSVLVKGEGELSTADAEAAAPAKEDAP